MPSDMTEISRYWKTSTSINRDLCTKYIRSRLNHAMSAVKAPGLDVASWECLRLICRSLVAYSSMIDRPPDDTTLESSTG